MGTEALSPGVKRPGREAAHLRTSNAELYLHSPARPHAVVLN
jgi:hypothetical protein